jgi:hypothetical protein
VCQNETLAVGMSVNNGVSATTLDRSIGFWLTFGEVNAKSKQKQGKKEKQKWVVKERERERERERESGRAR